MHAVHPSMQPAVLVLWSATHLHAFCAACVCVVPYMQQVYPDPVRVVAIGKSVEQLLSAPDADDNMKSSVEFCGGTHLTNTAQVRINYSQLAVDASFMWIDGSMHPSMRMLPDLQQPAGAVSSNLVNRGCA